MDFSTVPYSGSAPETSAANVAFADDGVDVIAAINVFRIFVSVIGLLGNAVVILSILLVTELRRKITSWYVLQLAVADTSYLITLPFQVVEDQRDEWTFPEWMCKAKNSVMYINYYSSIFLLTVMALDRYFAICHGFSETLRKFRTRRAVYIISATVWIVSILISVPVMMKTHVKGFKPYCKCRTEFGPPAEPKTLDEIDQSCRDDLMGDDIVKLPDFGNLTMLEFCRSIMLKEERTGYCGEPLDAAGDTGVERTSGTLSLGCHHLDATAAFKGFIFFNFIVMFAVPFAIITVCYTFIIRYMRKTAARMNKFSDQAGRGNENQKHRKVFIMCAMLVVAFTICWLPFHSVNLAKLVGIEGSSVLCRNLGYAVELLTFLNSAIDPFIYFIASRFRGQLRRIQRMSGMSTVMSKFTRRSSSESSNSRKSSGVNKRKSTNDSGEKNADNLITT